MRRAPAQLILYESNPRLLQSVSFRRETPPPRLDDQPVSLIHADMLHVSSGPSPEGATAS